MRQRLYASGYTWLTRGYVLYAGLFAVAFVSANIAHPIEMGGSIIPGIFISVIALMIVGIMALAFWRFSRVWLDDDVIEIRKGRTIVRVPIIDMTYVELVRSRPDYIRLGFKDRPPVSFIPIGGEGTRKQLYDLMPK